MRPPRAGYSGEQNPDLLKHPTNSWISAVGRLKPGARIEQARAELETRGVRVRADALPPAAARPPPARAAAAHLGRAAGRGRCQSASADAVGGAAARRRGRRGPADCLRQHREPAAVARLGPAARDGGAAGARREPRPAGSPAADRKRAAVAASAAAPVSPSPGRSIAAFQAAPPPPGALPLAFDFSIDQRVLLFSLLLSCATGILFGVAPALEASRPGLVPALKGVGRGAGGRRARFDLKKILVVGEVALSLLLLIAAGLFVRGLQSAQRDRSRLRRRQAGLGAAQHQPAALHQRAGARVLSPGGRAGGTAARRRVGDGRARGAARRQQPRAQPPRRRARPDPRPCAERGRRPGRHRSQS